MSETASKSSVTIKKYANRRLYNTATSTYVTLEDLSAMVKEGTEFNVYDAKTSEDITRSVLTQIIVEEEGKSGQQNLLPIGFLRQLIAFYGDNLQWMVPKYLEQSMEALTGNQDKIREMFQTSFGSIFPFGSTLEEMGKQNMAMFERTMQMFSPFNLSQMSNTYTEQTTTTSCTTTDCACPVTQNQKDQTEPKQTASVTNLKTRDNNTQNQKQNQKQNNQTQNNQTQNQQTQQQNTPMPSVQAATAGTGADDMQQKIANLQRQLADLAKSRA